MKATAASNRDDKPDFSPEGTLNRRGPSLEAMLPEEVIDELQKHILVDGFKLVIDLAQSSGSRLVDARDGREFVDIV